MIMTQNKLMEGYRMLRDEFNVTSANATKAMTIVDEFCRNQRCPECSEGSDECIDCKGRQEKEYRENSGAFDDHNGEDEIIEMILTVGRTMKKANEIGMNLAVDIQNLEKKIDDKMDDFEVDENFFKTIDKVNFQLEKIKEKKDGFDFGAADRINCLEEKIRHPVQSDGPEFDASEQKITIEKRPVILTAYEKGKGFVGSEAAQQAIG